MVLIAGAAGCADIDRALNRGGDTTCRDYLDQNADTQRTTIEKFIKERRGSDENLTDGTIEVARGGVTMLCSLPANADTPIEDATFSSKFDIRITPTR
ncbi:MULTISPECIES: hypothetical protein [unclassified Nocardia]|uniref:hypothetical protein n=1 Tax=unclassified Nocardia TaxID=2637762 RepID=UPI0033BC88C1